MYVGFPVQSRISTNILLFSCFIGTIFNSIALCLYLFLVLLSCPYYSFFIPVYLLITLSLSPYLFQSIFYLNYTLNLSLTLTLTLFLSLSLTLFLSPLFLSFFLIFLSFSSSPSVFISCHSCLTYAAKRPMWHFEGYN